MRLGPRSAWVLLALLLPAPCWGQSDAASDDLQAMARYWKDRRAGRGEPGATTEGVTIRVKPGQLIKLTPEDDWPAEVEWDWPEALASRDDTDRYYVDYGKRTLILPSDRPGQYRVTAWGIEAGRGALLPVPPTMPPAADAAPPPAGPGVPAARATAPAPRPKRLKVWTVIVEGDTAPPPTVLPGERTPGKTTTTTAKDIAAAVKEDLKNTDNKAPLADLRAAFERLAKEAESGTKWEFAGDANTAINAAMAAVPKDRLSRTYQAVANRIKSDPDVKQLGSPSMPLTLKKPRQAYATLLREIANALR